LPGKWIVLINSYWDDWARTAEEKIPTIATLTAKPEI